MISVDEAFKLIYLHLSQSKLRTQLISLSQIGAGSPYFLQENILADRPSPPFNKAMMDGIAIHHSQIKANVSYKISGFQAAGEPPKTLKNTNCVLEIATGAPLPKNTDCVIPYEEIDIKRANHPSNQDEMVTAINSKINKLSAAKMMHVQPTGKEYKKNDLLISSSTYLRTKHIAALASVGKTSVKVHRFPSVKIIVTGDELVPQNQKPKEWQIRESNGIMLQNLLNDWGFEDVSYITVGDDRKKMKQVMKHTIEKKEWVFITGSLSKGKYDFVPHLLEELSAKTHFYRVSQKPGKPFLFATKNKAMIFGLPGNPVSAKMCMRRYVITAYMDYLRASSQIKNNTKKNAKKNVKGKLKPFQYIGTMAKSIVFDKPLTYFPLVSVNRFKDKLPNSLQPSVYYGSGDFSALIHSDGFIELPKETKQTGKGQFMFYPWSPTD